MNKLFKYFVIAFFLPVIANAQTQELFSISEQYTVAGIDVLGNSYLIKKNTLYKCNASGSIICNYSDKGKGVISHVNTSNPLKITVLYAESGMLVVLDNTLSPIGNVIHLSELDIYDPVVCCAADDNGFRLYDAASGRFGFFQWNGNMIRQSVDIRSQFQNSFIPDDMVQSGKYTIALSQSEGMVVLDQSENIRNIIPPEKGIMSVGPDGFSVAAEDRISIFHPETAEESFISFQNKGIQKFYLHFPYLLVQHETKISLYLLSTQ